MPGGLRSLIMFGEKDMLLSIIKSVNEENIITLRNEEFTSKDNKCCLCESTLLTDCLGDFCNRYNKCIRCGEFAHNKCFMELVTHADKLFLEKERYGNLLGESKYDTNKLKCKQCNDNFRNDTVTYDASDLINELFYTHKYDDYTTSEESSDSD